LPVTLKANNCLEFFLVPRRTPLSPPRSASFIEILNYGTFATASKTSCKEASANPTKLKVSQGEMVKQLGVQDLIHYTNISKYELDKNEPLLAIVLAYACLVGIPVEQIIDEIQLTIRFPQEHRITCSLG
jgi:DNA-binding XRE family transcriptional regulator